MRIGFIDYYLDEWHANNYPKWIYEASNGEIEVELAYGQIDSPIGGRTNAQWCSDMGVERAETIEQVVDRCDGLIVLSPDNCEMHEALSRLPLESGKPTYIDKTFAPDYETARRIFAVGKAHGTPCWSTSALRFAREYQNQPQADAVASWGPNGFETYSIHQLEPILMLIDAEPKRALAVKGEDWYCMTIEFEDGRAATLSGYDKGAPFMMNVTGKDGARVINVESDFFHDFMLALTDFFRNPTDVVPHAETLRIMKARTLGVRAIEAPGVWAEA